VPENSNANSTRNPNAALVDTYAEIKFESIAKVEIEGDAGGVENVLIRAEISEAMSELFVITAEIMCRGGDGNPYTALGTPVSILSHLGDQPLREYNGILTDVEYLTNNGANYHYLLTIRPSLYFLSHNRDFRIFQDLSTPEIVAKVLTERNIQFRQKLDVSYIKRAYVVQYGESDFTFVSRLLEEEGISYFFIHQNGLHELVLTDNTSSADKGRVQKLQYDIAANHEACDQEVEFGMAFLSSWHESARDYGEAKVTLRAYDFETPAVDLSRDVKTTTGSIDRRPWHKGEIYQFPERFRDGWESYKRMAQKHSEALADLGRLARLRMEALEAPRRIYSGAALTTALKVGEAFDLVDPPSKRFNTDNKQGFVIMRLHTIVSGRTTETESNSSTDAGSVFQAVGKHIPWKPPLVTPRPVARGPETATVTGPPGEQIYTDETGRIKVQFHWDRQGNKDDKSSCWIRVSQTGGLGNLIMPRVSQEVIVDFINGNPDLPIVTGRVINPTELSSPRYKLPDHKTRAIWRTSTYGDKTKALDKGAMDLEKGLENLGVNELSFEDKEGEEEVFLYVQRNMRERVRNNHSQTIGHNEDVIVGRDETKDVKHDANLTIGNDETKEVKNDAKLTIGNNYTVDIKQNHSLTITGNETLKTTGKREETLESDHKITTKGQTTHDTEAAVSMTVKSGDHSLAVKSGSMKAEAAMNYSLKANAGITIECGQSKITITPASIKIESAMIEINGQAVTKVSGGGMVQVQGGIIMLN
jgi:type VI secretion system secreted protein VgrG